MTQRRVRNEEVPEFLEPLQGEKVAMEASTYIIPMYRRLVDDGYNVTVPHPKKTRYIAEACGEVGAQNVLPYKLFSYG